MSKRVLIVALHFAPAPLAHAQRMAKLVKYLEMETGWEPAVVCSNYSPSLLPYKDVSLLDEIPDSADIIRVPCFLTTQSNHAIASKSIVKNTISAWRKLTVVPDTYGDWVYKAEKACLARWPNAERFSAIISSGPPNSAYLCGAQLAGKWNLPLLIDMRDPWRRRSLSKNPLEIIVARRNRRQETRIYEQASFIIANTDGNADSLSNQFPDYRSKITVIPNGYDRDDLNSDCGPDLKSGCRVNATIDILYLGGIRGFSTTPPFEGDFLQGMRDFFDCQPAYGNNIRIHFVGGDKEEVARLSAHYRLEKNCIAHGIVPANNVGRPLRTADAYLLVMPFDSESGWIPSKLYYYLVGSKPIFGILPKGSAEKVIISAGASAVICRPKDRNGILHSLSSFINKLVTSSYAEPINTGYYDRRNIAGLFGSLLNSVIEDPYKGCLS